LTHIHPSQVAFSSPSLMSFPRSLPVLLHDARVHVSFVQVLLISPSKPQPSRVLQVSCSFIVFLLFFVLAYDCFVGVARVLTYFKSFFSRVSCHHFVNIFLLQFCIVCCLHHCSKKRYLFLPSCCWLLSYRNSVHNTHNGETKTSHPAGHVQLTMEKRNR
jgi:hypothetical protein